MTHSPREFARADFSCRVIVGNERLIEIYQIMSGQNLLWCAWPEIAADEWSAELLCKKLGAADTLVIGAYFREELAGVMSLRPAAERTLCADTGLCAFRPYFGLAVPLCLEALSMAIKEIRAESFMGRTAACFRHVTRLFGAAGFRPLGRIPGLVWLARRGRFTDGIISMADRDSVRAAFNKYWQGGE